MGDRFAEGDPDELPRHLVYVDEFFMGRQEVTNYQYYEALNWALSQGNLITVTNGVVYKFNSGVTTPYCDTNPVAPGSGITWDGTSFGVVAGREDYAMVHVTWHGSAAYANWRSAMEGRQPAYDPSNWTWDVAADGYRLPTEAEWEKAARGGSIGRRFPWSDSDTIQHARANYNSLGAFPYDSSPTSGFHPAFSGGPQPFTSPVDYFPANDYGVHGMAGNVLEWCYDWYGGSYYANSPYDNPTGQTSGTSRVLRGGSWSQSARNARCSQRSIKSPGSRDNKSGFRLAMNGRARDANGNGIADMCEAVPPPVLQEPSGLNKGRFISFSVPTADEVAIRVILTTLHQVVPPYAGGPSIPFSSFEGQVRWVGPPISYVESTSLAQTFYAAQLQCTPHYRDWSTVGLLHVSGSAIVPSSIYEVENVSSVCIGTEATCEAASAPLQIMTTRWGDVTEAYSPPAITAQPDVADIAALVSKFRNAPGAPIKARALLAGDDAFGNITSLDGDFGFTHIAACVEAFRGKPYPHTIQNCP
jgi:formylglycine-generating enzyme required for sulfatase activity